jgi:Spy/CpxP family protein refolding chaperone
MRPPLFLAALALAGSLACGAAQAQTSPYVGQESRDIKALSAQEVDDLLNARGMALAKAAELNGYPGPAHTLEWTAELKLTQDQARSIREIKDRLDAAAKPLGAQIVARERELDKRFSSGGITEPEITSETRAIGELQGRLRSLHLAAHLATKAKLDAGQIARYNQLRGYSSATDPQAHDPAKRHGN